MPIIPAAVSPDQLSSLGTLAPAPGAYVADTDEGTLTGPGVNFQGVDFNEVAVFTFDQITIGDGVTITAQGSRPLALLSKGSATISGTGGINASALNNQAGVGGSGAAQGPGAGHSETGGLSLFGGGGGGGFGGSGGASATDNRGGKPYGNLAEELQGGSGGGQPGGGGGGVVQIGAADTLTIAGTSGVAANGGNGHAGQPSGTQPPPIGFNVGTGGGGGGSGGGILLSGGTVVLETTLSAVGGDGNTGGAGGGGGGGGGRITVLHGSGGFQNTGSATVSGGKGGQAPNDGNGQDGSEGVFAIAELPT